MRKSPIILTILLLASAVSSPAFAKKSNNKKADIKEWQHRKDDMQPLQLKDIVEENHRLKMGYKKLTEEIKLTRQEQESLLRLKAKIDALRTKKGQPEPWDNEYYTDLDELFTSIQPKKVISIDGLTQDDWAVDKDGRPYIKGVVFKVQIGAYRKRDLSNVLEDRRPQEAFEHEYDENLNKYTLRHFRDYQKADEFKKEVRALGIKDAWIVPFKDGKRVPLKTVLKQVIKNKK